MSKKLMVVFAICALMAMGGALTVQAASATYNMVFVGHCDGIHFMVDTTWGIVTGYRTGCDSGAIAGIRCSLIKEGGVQAIVYRDKYERIHVQRANHTYTSYDVNGAVVASGTWNWGSAFGPSTGGLSQE